MVASFFPTFVFVLLYRYPPGSEYESDLQLSGDGLLFAGWLQRLHDVCIVV